ncbi:MAG: LysR family transcriptional regulator [Chloroflexi bacterium]|nr:LysR family transcriptional regulator [Chloroflexota bacterium]
MPNITLAQLQAFNSLASSGSFTRAARQLSVTQPAVTQQIRALERLLGVTLVDVVGRRTILTNAGQFLAARAEALLSGAAALEREMGEFAAARTGELYLGATLTIGTYTLPALLARFARRCPAIRVHVAVANTAITAARVRHGRLDLALVEGPLDDDDFDAIPYQDDCLLLVMSPCHHLAGRAQVHPQELEGEPFVWREQGSGTRALAEQKLARAGLVVRSATSLPSGEGVARAVQAGLGLAILSELVVEHAVASGRLAAAEIAGVDLRRTFRIVTLRGRTLSPAARDLIEVVRDQDAGVAIASSADVVEERRNRASRMVQTASPSGAAT